MNIWKQANRARVRLLRRAERRIISDVVGKGYDKAKLDAAIAEPDESANFMAMDADLDLRGAIDSGKFEMGAL